MSWNSQPLKAFIGSQRLGLGGRVGSAKNIDSSETYQCEPLRIVFGVINVYAVVVKYDRVRASNRLLCETKTVLLTISNIGIDNLTSNQVGLHAELKHINKRRKRN